MLALTPALFIQGLAADELALTRLSGSALQGDMLVYKTQPEAQIWLDDVPLYSDSKGRFVIGFHRDDQAPQKLRLSLPSGAVREETLIPIARNYEIQRIDGLARRYVSPPQKLLDRIAADRDAVQQARAVRGISDDFLNHGFDWPIDPTLKRRITGVYGAQRILNGQPRQPHYGIDIAAPTGTAVLAPADGTVSLVKDLYYTGWTIIITHGHFISSTYSHLADVQVAQGEEVLRGSVIGTVGSTGRSTGPHLDWRFNWRQKRLDPDMLLTK